MELDTDSKRQAQRCLANGILCFESLQRDIELLAKIFRAV